MLTGKTHTKSHMKFLQVKSFSSLLLPLTDPLQPQSKCSSRSCLSANPNPRQWLSHTGSPIALPHMKNFWRKKSTCRLPICLAAPLHPYFTCSSILGLLSNSSPSPMHVLSLSPFHNLVLHEEVLRGQLFVCLPPPLAAHLQPHFTCSPKLCLSPVHHPNPRHWHGLNFGSSHSPVPCEEVLSGQYFWHPHSKWYHKLRLCHPQS